MTGLNGTTAAVARPRTVTAAVVLLLIHAAVLLVGGSSLAVANWNADGLTGIARYTGLVLSVIGFGYVVLAVPASLGQRWARPALVILTVPPLAYGLLAIVSGAVSREYGPWLATAVLGLVALPPVAIVLLYLPASRPFFRRRRPTAT